MQYILYNKKSVKKIKEETEPINPTFKEGLDEKESLL